MGLYSWLNFLTGLLLRWFFDLVMSLIHQTFRQFSFRNIKLVIFEIHLVNGSSNLSFKLYSIHLSPEVIGKGDLQ